MSEPNVEPELVIVRALKAMIRSEAARRDRLRTRMAQGSDHAPHSKPQRRQRALREAEELIEQGQGVLLAIDRDGILNSYFGEGAAGIKGHDVLSAMAREYVDRHGVGSAERDIIETLGLDVPAVTNA